MKLFKVFFWGLIISFLGTLPLGTLNIAAMQIAVQESIKAAFYFSLGTLIAEMVLIRIALIGINWIREQKLIFIWMEWITLIIIIILAIGSFVAATSIHHTKSVFLANNMNRFLLGASMSFLSPMHIPFWFGWSTVLFTKKILEPKNNFYNIYIIGIGIGTFLANFIFIFGAKLIVAKSNANDHIVNWVLGSVFSITAIIQFIKIILHKDAAGKLKFKPKFVLKKTNVKIEN